MNKINSCFGSIITLLVGGISFILCAQSLFTDVRIDQYEKVYFVEAPFVLKVIILLILVAITCFFYRRDGHVIWNKKTIYVYFAISLFFVLISQNQQHDDMLHVLECAKDIHNGDFSSLHAGEYLNIFKNQHGFVLFLVLLSSFSGEMNYIIIQLLNAGSVFLCLLALDRVFGIEEAPKTQLYFLAIVFFLPIIFYNNLVYGTVIGLSLAIISLVFQYSFLNKYIIKDAFISGIGITLAILFKSNFSVFLIAILIIYICNITEHSWKKIVLSVGLTIGLFLAANLFVSFSLPLMAGDISLKTKGTPMVSYVAMGMSDESLSEAGWYSGYNNSVYSENNSDYELAEADSIKYLKKNVRYYLDNPQKFVDFMHRKVSSTWCDSSFQSFYFNRIGYQGAMGEHSELYNDLMADSGRLHRMLYVFMDGYQIYIYLGVMLFCIYSINNSRIEKIVGLLVFLGGFIFHLIWETKSTYAYIYFVLLIPYAIKGYWMLCDHYVHDFKNNTQSFKKRLLYGCSILIFCSTLFYVGYHIKLNTGTNAWNAYLNEHRYITNRLYDLISISNADRVIDRVYLIVDVDDRWYYELQDKSRLSRLTAQDSDVVMEEYSDASELSEYMGKWQIEREKGAYLIRLWPEPNKVLSLDDDGSLCISDYEAENNNQLWMLRK